MYQISEYSLKKAKDLGVDILPSKRKYKKIIKELEVKIYELQLEIDHLKRLLALNHIKYE